MRPLSLRGGVVMVATALLFLGGSCALVVRSFVGEQHGSTEIVRTVEPQAKDYLRVEVYLATIDPVQGRMGVELYFYPKGRFDAGDQLLTVPLEIEVSSMSGESLHFESGRRMFPRSVEFGFLDGSVADYPLDVHRVRIEIRALESTGEGSPPRVVPVELDLDSHFHGFAIAETPFVVSERGYLGSEIQLKRSGLVIGTVSFCLVIMWALTGMNLLMLWAVLTHRMEVDVELFAYISGMIVALYFFREVLPDAPPFLGVLADYVAFFWAELITAICAFVFALIWYRQLIKRPAVVGIEP